jgi:hypothetical protein
VAGGLFAHATSDPRGAVATLLRLSTPTLAATFVPGANVLYASDGVPWGTLTIDGKRMPTSAALGAMFTVTQGPHQLVYQARFFPTLRCVFSAPDARTDTCPLNTSQDATQFLSNRALARVLDLRATGDALQRDQRAALLRVADSDLKADTLTANIAPGDRYLDGQGHVVTATQPLRFTLTSTLGVTGPSGANVICAQPCPENQWMSGLPDPSNNALWHVSMTITPTWAISDLNGRRLTPLNYLAVAQGSPGSPPSPFDIAPQTSSVDIEYTVAGWQIRGLQGTGSQTMQMYAFNSLNAAAANAPTSGVSTGIGAFLMVATNPLDGCVIDAQIGADVKDTARLLWRFGVLLAIDTTARRLFPHLPVANAAEQALAARIKAQQPQPPQPQPPA